MLTIRTILHPTDFSDYSAATLRFACALTREYGARLVVVHAEAPPPIVYGEGALPLDPEIQYRHGRESLKQLEIPDTDIPVERRFEEGDAATAILRVAKVLDSGLIVMGTHGRTGLARLLMGSVAEKVVRSATCPVITLNPQCCAKLTVESIAPLTTSPEGSFPLPNLAATPTAGQTANRT